MTRDELSSTGRAIVLREHILATGRTQEDAHAWLDLHDYVEEMEVGDVIHDVILRSETPATFATWLKAEAVTYDTPKVSLGAVEDLIVDRGGRAFLEVLSAASAALSRVFEEDDCRAEAYFEEVAGIAPAISLGVREPALSWHWLEALESCQTCQEPWLLARRPGTVVRGLKPVSAEVYRVLSRPFVAGTSRPLHPADPVDGLLDVSHCVGCGKTASRCDYTDSGTCCALCDDAEHNPLHSTDLSGEADRDVVLLQRPAASFFTDALRSNFDMSVPIGRVDPLGAFMMWENTATGVADQSAIRT